MIEPMADAKFEMWWDGRVWNYKIENFNLVAINSLADLGDQLADLIRRDFRQKDAEAFFGVNHEVNSGVGIYRKEKFKGNK